MDTSSRSRICGRPSPLWPMRAPHMSMFGGAAAADHLAQPGQRGDGRPHPRVGLASTGSDKRYLTEPPGRRHRYPSPLFQQHTHVAVAAVPPRP